MWRELELVPEQQVPSAIERLIRHFQRPRSNGGAQYASFRYTPHPVLDWFIQTNRLTPPYLDFPSGIVTHPVVRQTLPDLQIPEVLTEPLALEPLDTFDVESRLVRDLVVGGPYDSFVLPRRDARFLASEFVDAIEQAGEQCWVGFSWMAWNSWFCDISWDRTWLGLNASTQRVWLLCVTDTD